LGFSLREAVALRNLRRALEGAQHPSPKVFCSLARPLARSFCQHTAVGLSHSRVYLAKHQDFAHSGLQASIDIAVQKRSAGWPSVTKSPRKSCSPLTTRCWHCAAILSCRQTICKPTYVRSGTTERLSCCRPVSQGSRRSLTLLAGHRTQSTEKITRRIKGDALSASSDGRLRLHLVCHQ
jgi:hypothetical protein